MAASTAAPSAQADVVRVLCAGAAQPVIRQLTPELARATGHTLDASFDTVGALRAKARAGEAFDILILSAEAMADPAVVGRIATAGSVDLGSVTVALAVRAGAPVPDVSTPEAFKRALLSAASIAHANPARGATAGAHFARVIDRLGITDAIGSRITVLGFGGDVIDGVAQGRFAIGVSQSSEIVAHPGVFLAGALPEPYAHRTRYLAAKASAAGPASDSLLQLLASPKGQRLLRESGFTAP